MLDHAIVYIVWVVGYQISGDSLSLICILQQQPEFL